MKQELRQFLTAVLVGLVIPGLLLHWVDKRYRAAAGQPQAEIQPTQGVTEPRYNTSLTVKTSQGLVDMELEDYLTCVLLREMPASFEEEALKAQAVVARTYTKKRQLSQPKHPEAAVCTDSACCQGYCTESEYLANGGTEQAIAKMRRAVQLTAGQYLTYCGQVIEATYFSASGGRTEDAAAVWGAEIPYLQSVESPGEENAAHHTDTVTMSAEAFAEKLNIAPQGTPDTWIGVVMYTTGGGVDTMQIGDSVFRGTQLRELLGLRSTAIRLTVEGDTVHITTSGFGHRVGMSQYGADAMAVGGSTYREILAHYYPGTTLTCDDGN